MLEECLFGLQLQLQDERQLLEGRGLKRAQAAIRICLGGLNGQGVSAGKEGLKKPLKSKHLLTKYLAFENPRFLTVL